MDTMHFYLCYDKQLSGHSVAALGYAKAMTHTGIAVEVKAFSSEDWAKVDTDSFETPATVIQCFVPPLMKPIPKVTNIAIPYHEWTRMPKPWVKQFDQFDDVWVSSRYLQDVLMNSGFNGRCTYIPIPIETSKGNSKTSWEVQPPFTFLSVGEWHFRKGFHLLMEAFNIAFPEAGEAELIIKTSPNVDYQPGQPSIRIISERLSDEELSALYTKADAYITTSLAEGLGLPIAEAMSFGLPVLAPTWSGMTEFCGDGKTFEIPFEVHPQPYCSRPDYYAPGQECAIISAEECAKLMRHVVSISAKERELVTRNALSHLKENFSLEQVSGMVRAHLSQL